MKTKELMFIIRRSIYTKQYMQYAFPREITFSYDSSQKQKDIKIQFLVCKFYNKTEPTCSKMGIYIRIQNFVFRKEDA